MANPLDLFGVVPLWIALACVCVLCCLLRSRDAALTAGVLLYDWFFAKSLGDISTLGWSDKDPWYFFIPIDLVAAIAVIFLAPKLNAVRAAVAIIFALMIGVNGLYGWQGYSPLADWNHYWGLHYLAWAQLWIVAVWGVSDYVGRSTADSSWRNVHYRRPDRAAMVEHTRKSEEA